MFVNFQLAVASLGTTALAFYPGPPESLVPSPRGNEARQLSDWISWELFSMGCSVRTPQYKGAPCCYHALLPRSSCADP